MSNATSSRRTAAGLLLPGPAARPLALTVPPAPLPPPVRTGSEAERLEILLSELYRIERFGNPTDAYLRDHARPPVVRGQVRAFLWYRSFLPPAGAVLDWGCNHAPDSCLLRGWAGGRLELHGCDFRPAATFPVFHDYAQLEYTPLTDNLTLPYRAERFDAVIGSGVLEHTAMDYEALKEVYRVLKPGGTLILTYLPNWLSYREWYLRSVRGGHHRRLYSLRQACGLLRHTGFEPAFADYQSLVWARLFGSAGAGRLGRVLDFLMPVRRFASTLRLVAHKVHGF